MKAKVNIPSRGKSNPPLRNLPPSIRLEEENRRMEQTLKELQERAQQAFKNSGLSTEDGSRWASASQNLPLRNYGKAVIENKAQGTNALNAKPYRDNPSATVLKPSREKPSREKIPPSREKLPTLSNVTTSTPRESSKSNKENKSQNEFFKDVLMGTSTSTTSTNTSVNKSGAKPQKQVPTAQSSVSSAENNLAKALLKQKETSEVGKFLEEVGLPQYLQVFHENGFDDLETIMEIETKHLVDMKIPAGHQIKFIKKIEQLNQKTKDLQRTILSNPKVVVQTAEDSTTVGINMSQIESSRESYFGTKGSEYIQVAEPAKEKAIGSEKTGGELLQGTFDEAESHKSFLEALNEWRSGKAKPQEPEKVEPKPREGRSRSKKVRFNEPAKKKEESEDDDGVPYISTKAMRKKEEDQKKKEEKKSFFFSGDNSWNVVQMPDQKESGTEAQKLKVSCWNCYRLITNEADVKHAADKQFCSDECVKAYKESNTTKCTKKGCQNSFLKEVGVIREGDWFCSDKCASQSLEREGGNRNGRSLEEQSKRGGSSQREGSEENGDEGFLTFDFENDSAEKDVLSMAELEEKYKNFS